MQYLNVLVCVCVLLSCSWELDGLLKFLPSYKRFRQFAKGANLLCMGTGADLATSEYKT